MRIAVLGAGSWGTAIASHAATHHDVLLWTRHREQCDDINLARRNARAMHGLIADYVMPESIRATTELDDARRFVGTDGLCLVATSVAGLRPVVSQLASARLPLIWLCKGLERETEKLPHQVVAEALGAKPGPIGVLSGPSFALEVARGLPCALVVASADPGLCDLAQSALHHGVMRVYASDDLLGVELAGALKNVLAIAAGICDGLALGANARAALIARGLVEMVRLGAALGAHAETFYGLAGVGDLVLTCTGDLSRNRQVGLRLAKGEHLAAVLSSLNHVAEGVLCARAAVRLARRAGVELPIVEAVNAVIDGQRSARDAVLALLAREARDERQH